MPIIEITIRIVIARFKGSLYDVVKNDAGMAAAKANSQIMNGVIYIDSQMPLHAQKEKMSRLHSFLYENLQSFYKR